MSASDAAAIRETVPAKEAKLYDEMTAHFGDLWLRRNGETDEDDRWGPVLEDLSMRQVEAGCLLIRKRWESEWPPHPGQFRRWAMDAIRPYDIAPPARQIGVKRAQPDVEEAGLASLRKIVGGR